LFDDIWTHFYHVAIAYILTLRALLALKRRLEGDKAPTQSALSKSKDPPIFRKP